MLTHLFFLAMCKQSNIQRWNGYINYVEHRENMKNFYSVHTTFQNNVKYPVDVFKLQNIKRTIDPSGIVETTIQPGNKTKITCATGDTFTAKINAPGTKDHGKMLLAHDVARIYIKENTCEEKNFQSCQRKEFTADQRWTPPDSFMFSNTMHETVNAFYVDEYNMCEEKVAEIAQKSDHHLQSTVGHSFRLRTGEGKLIQEFTLDEIHINDLETDEDFHFSEKASQLFNVVHLNILKKSVEKHKKIIEELESQIIYFGSGNQTCL